MSGKNDSYALINAIQNGQNIKSVLANCSKEMFEQIDARGNTALMIAAQNHPEIVGLLLAAIPEESKKTVHEKVNRGGWTALMIAERFQPEVVGLLLADMPEDLRKTVHNKVTSGGWTQLMKAARHQPKLMGLLLDAMLEDSKKTVHEQVNPESWRPLMLAARHQPKILGLLLDAMSHESVVERFKQEGHGFTSSSRTIEALLSTKNLEVLLGLLKKDLIPKGSNAFKCVVKHKQQLLDYIRAQDIDTRRQLLKEISDNDEHSALARVFHTSRGVLAPRLDRGILGQAITAYKELPAGNNLTQQIEKEGSNEGIGLTNSVDCTLLESDPTPSAPVFDFEDRLCQVGSREPIPDSLRSPKTTLPAEAKYIAGRDLINTIREFVEGIERSAAPSSSMPAEQPEDALREIQSESNEEPLGNEPNPLNEREEMDESGQDKYPYITQLSMFVKHLPKQESTHANTHPRFFDSNPLVPEQMHRPADSSRDVSEEKIIQQLEGLPRPSTDVPDADKQDDTVSRMLFA